MGRDDEDQAFREAMRELGLGRRGARAGRGDDDGELAALMAALDEAPAPTATSRGAAGPARTAQGAPRAPDLGAEDRAFLEAMGALEPEAVPAEATDERAPSDPTRGTRRRLSQRIKVGTVVEERTLDLHGKTRDEAFALLRIFVAAARRDGLDVVKVITGRGLHSLGAAVLQRAIGPWLMRDLGEHVREVIKAPPDRGGEGATYVFLRSPER
ncbi:MAG: hypothetical protein CVU56_12205 [Deltaproteobacteria bacterium HGW-Deltaproteobacteria-14]|nr:MAG: hypothetical protein CVU56_12205 [Deltaproteobacteria bacterium HGW-Deltaproteobacteria-14]